ncbi:MAG: MBL fold metallo-hydrolase [Myxococcales bacterium]|nr:MBL fold metallo-hydrolase [Myxococcales bacterium]
MLRFVLFGGWLCSLVVGLVALSCSAPTPPSLVAIRPASAPNQQDSPLTLLGEGFDSTAKAWLVGADGSKIALQELRVLEPGKAEAVLPKGAAAGFYDVLWEQDGASSRLGSAFEVLSGVLTIDMVDVGQGDALLIRVAGGKTVLIDAGREEDVDALIDFVRKEGINRFDIVIATHYDADHVGGFAKLVYGEDGRPNTDDDRRPTEAWWDRGGFSKSTSYSSVRSLFPNIRKTLDGSGPESFPSVDLGAGVKLQVVTTNGSVLQKDGTLAKVDCGADENCRSVGTLISLGKFQFWTAGDLTGGGIDTPDVESTLAKIVDPVEVYRAHHHGSRTSSSQGLLDALSPQMILISAGRQNSYCHPSDEVLKRISPIPDLSLFVTTSGMIDGEKCGYVTSELVSVMGQRALLNAGNIRVQAGEDRYTVRSASGEVRAFEAR